MLHLSINARLRAFGERAGETVQKEVKQIYDLSAYMPLDANKLNTEEKKKASSLMFLTEKRCGKMEATAPTLCLNSTFVMGAMEAHEKQEVTVVNLSGSFLCISSGCRINVHDGTKDLLEVCVNK